MARIVVMGAGIGGISQGYELRQTLGQDHEIVLIGDSEPFELTPSKPNDCVIRYSADLRSMFRY